MTTEEAFEKLIHTERWFEFLQVTALQATKIKDCYNRKKIGLDSIFGYLHAIGAFCTINIKLSSKTHHSYINAFKEMLSLPNITTVLKITPQQYCQLKNKCKKKPNDIRISTMHKHLETAGYVICLDWQMPDLQEMSSQVKTIDSVFTSGITHCAITNTNTFFKEFIETVGWYKRNPYMYPQKAQHVKKKYYNNLLCLDEITNILIDSGCIYDLKITSPDGGAYFSDYATAYEILSKIYNINKTLGIDNLEAHKIKDGTEKRLRIDIILQFLIKIGCDIDIKWELPELVEI